jgi:SHS2 domain-containing protein
VRITFEAETPAQLFERAAREVTRTLLPSETIGAALREKLTVEAADLSALLKNWVDVILACLYEQRMAFSKFQILHLANQDGIWRLQAEATGEIVDPVLIKKICSSTAVAQTGSVYRAEIHLG